eukprot:TRINITY_DN7585_c1_g3_i2.p2 TRINITY_DN7585_c1_g3~~TRINITY_DN7585_c1_g3_i2.p2  ORF type:complete len:105 (-),score=5.30 TRINITY_DN7585_c1_g3_i2:553-867(-)
MRILIVCTKRNSRSFFHRWNRGGRRGELGNRTGEDGTDDSVLQAESLSGGVVISTWHGAPNKRKEEATVLRSSTVGFPRRTISSSLALSLSWIFSHFVPPPLRN